MVIEWVSVFENWKSSDESRTRRRMSDTSNARRQTIETRKTLLLHTLSYRKNMSKLLLMHRFKRSSFKLFQWNSVKEHAYILIELNLRYVSSLSFHLIICYDEGGK